MKRFFAAGLVRRRTIGAGKPIALDIHEEDARMESWLRVVLKATRASAWPCCPLSSGNFSLALASLFASFPMLSFLHRSDQYLGAN